MAVLLTLCGMHLTPPPKVGLLRLIDTAQTKARKGQNVVVSLQEDHLKSSRLALVDFPPPTPGATLLTRPRGALGGGGAHLAPPPAGGGVGVGGAC